MVESRRKRYLEVLGKKMRVQRSKIRRRHLESRMSREMGHPGNVISYVLAQLSQGPVGDIW